MMGRELGLADTHVRVWAKPVQPDVSNRPVVEIRVDSLSIADSPRIGGESSEHVRALAAAETQLPPILVHHATMRVIDGVHRLRVAQLRRQEKIAVQFFEGDDADAFVLAVKANITHGLPLSLADRKLAASRVIISHPHWSDRMIASVTGISAKTVAELRGWQSEVHDCGDARIGRDGRIRPIDGTQGRLIASKLMADDPGLSLRQVAQMAGISPETARDVRNRLKRGEYPLPGDGPRRQLRVGHGPEAPAAKENQDGKEKEEAQRPEGGLAGASRLPAGRDRAAVVQRLRADPALRLTGTGRTLLGLLQVHTLKAEEWKKISDNVPPHWSYIIAHLARECADMWTTLANSIEDNGT
jgi:ParB-like chromosome segregation protein Spo0J